MLFFLLEEGLFGIPQDILFMGVAGLVLGGVTRWGLRVYSKSKKKAADQKSS